MSNFLLDEGLFAILLLLFSERRHFRDELFGCLLQPRVDRRVHSVDCGKHTSSLISCIAFFLLHVRVDYLSFDV